jgi:hypothetical protein
MRCALLTKELESARRIVRDTQQSYMTEYDRRVASEQNEIDANRRLAFTLAMLAIVTLSFIGMHLYTVNQFMQTLNDATLNF